MNIKFIPQAAGQAPGTAEIWLYDYVGEWGISAAEFSQQLAALGAVHTLHLRINSPGGNVFEGIAIYNMLLRHPARVVVDVDGLAASIATVIAMAGDEIRMAANAMWMVHEPAVGVRGSSADLRKAADQLDNIRGVVIDTYCRRTGMAVEVMAQLLANETWLTAAEAVAQRFVDTVTGPQSVTAVCRTLDEFRNVPPAVRAALAALPHPEAQPLPQEDHMLDAKLAAALGLEATADVAAALAAVNKLKEVQGAAPDPAQFAPVAVVSALQAEVAALKSGAAAREHAELLAAGLADGRILAGMKPWAETLPAAELRKYLDAAPPIAALVGQQTAGRAPAGQSTDPVAAAKAEWEANADLRHEFSSLVTYTAYKKAVAEGRARILKKGE